MTVSDLKEMLEGLDGEMQVLIPMGMEFDGAFYSPCMAESGLSGMGLEDLDEEEISERKLLNQDIDEEDAFMLVPCGFFEESHEVDPSLN